MSSPFRLVGSAKLLASVLGALVLSLLVLASAATQAHADQRLIASDPQSKAELKRAPGWVNLAFDSQVDAGIAKVLVLNADGQNVTTSDLIVEFNTITTQLIDQLPQGTYTVQYRADESGSPLGGSFQFSYGSGAFSPDANTTWKGTDSEPEIIKNPNPNATTSQPPYRNTESPEPPPVDPTQAEPDPTATASSGTQASGSASSGSQSTPADGPATDSTSSALPWILGGLGAVVLLGAAALLYLRTRRSDRP